MSQDVKSWQPEQQNSADLYGVAVVCLLLVLSGRKGCLAVKTSSYKNRT